MSAQPGWYDDNVGNLRWWDGTQWTAHTRPLVSPAAPAAPIPPVPAPPEEIPDAEDAPPVETIASVFDPPAASDRALIPPIPKAQLGAVASSGLPESVVPAVAATKPATPTQPAATRKAAAQQRKQETSAGQPALVRFNQAFVRNPTLKIALIGSLIALAIILFFFFNRPDPVRTGSNTSSSSSSVVPPSPLPQPTSSTVDPDDKDEALENAQVLAEYGDMSKAMIYEFLVQGYTGDVFTPEAAQYAIDNVQGDWNQNALNFAQSLSDYGHMSFLQIQDALAHPQQGAFEPDEVQYALANLQADFMQNALESAREVQEVYPGWSLDQIRDHLLESYIQFTPEEVQYALDNL